MPSEEDKVCGKALYGLKQAPRIYYPKIDALFSFHHFVKNVGESTFNVLKERNNIVPIPLQLDDINEDLVT